MPNWLRGMIDLVLPLYCVYGADLINRRFFNGNDYGFRFAFVVAVLFVIGYPFWGWKRYSPWHLIGRWSFLKWVLSGVVVWLLVILIELFARVVVRYYS